MAAKKTSGPGHSHKIGQQVDSNFAKCQIEALLFASGKTMSEELLGSLAKLELSIVKNALMQLQEEYVQRNGAITLYNDPTGWRLMVKERFIGTVKGIVADTELSKACMETLAIIAYKYPKVLQSEVIEIRGGGAYEHMAELERLGFIRRDPEGRSYAVKLTEKFFSYFEVAGGADIREIFKKIKPKAKPQESSTKQKTLGDLEVVDSQPDAAKNDPQKMLGGMDVVDSEIQSLENEGSEGAGAPKDDAEKPFVQASGKFEQTPEEIAAHNAFLDELDRRIASISERNTANDNDDSLKRKPLPGAQELSENNDPAAVSAEDLADIEPEHESTKEESPKEDSIAKMLAGSAKKKR